MNIFKIIFNFMCFQKPKVDECARILSRSCHFFFFLLIESFLRAFFPFLHTIDILHVITYYSIKFSKMIISFIQKLFEGISCKKHDVKRL